MSSVVISGDTSGAITLQAPSVSGNTTLNLPASSGTVLTQNSSAPANSFVVDASGNVGIGTSSPSYKLQVSTSLPTGVSLGALDSSSFVSNGIAFRSLGNQAGISGTTYAKQIFAGGSPDNMEIYNGANYPLVFGTNATERMRIDSSGNLLVGATSEPSASVSGVKITSPIVAYSRFSAGNNNGDIWHIGFLNGNGLVGRIATNGTATSYVTSSDYRLKENVQPMIGALDIVAKLNPVTFTWKTDNSDGQGFIAHELQAVVPDCVSGEKDAVDDDGNPVYQGIDTSFLVATLTAAIQELKAIVDEQAEKIKALEAK